MKDVDETLRDVRLKLTKVSDHPLTILKKEAAQLGISALRQFDILLDEMIEELGVDQPK